MGFVSSAIIQQGKDEDHFDSDYFAHGCQWHLLDLKGSEQGYRIAKDRYELAAKKIYDATVGGHLTISAKRNLHLSLQKLHL